MTSPFDMAATYRARGWSGTLPLPHGQKGPPPGGFTGYGGAWPTVKQIEAWQTNGYADANLALRLPGAVVGLDIDAYADKPGRQTLATLLRQWGPLPPTWRSTARADDLSGIRLYRVPTDLDWPTEAGPGIEIIRYAHRYMVVWPSMHPEGGTYRWIRPDGTPALSEIPGLDLPDLPPAWLAGLTGHGAEGEHVKPGSRAALRERGKPAAGWLRGLPKGEPCRYVGGLAADLEAAARRQDGNAYDHTRDTVMALLGAGEIGHPGVLAVLNRGRAAYIATVAAARGGAKVAEAEYDRFTVGGIVKLLEKPGDRAGTGCDCEGFTIAGVIGSSSPIAAEPTTEPWPTPLAEAAYHGVLGKLVRAVEAETEADPVALLGSLLAYVGALAGGAVTMHQGSWQAARLFVVLVGDTGTGRKGTAGDAVRDMIRLVDPDFYKIVVPGLGSGEGLVGHMKRLRAEGGTETRALLVENELGRLLAVMSRDGSTLSPILRDGWDGTPMGRTLAREEMIVHEHHVCLLGHITVPELRAKLASLDAANGFANRFLWLAVRRPHLIPVPERVDRLVTGLWAPLARALVKAREPKVMAWTAPAAEAWTTFYIGRAIRPAPGMLAAVTGRAEAQVARLALTYALADGADDVGPEHLAAAEAMWAYAEQSARYIFGTSTGNRHADYLLRLIRGEGEIDWDTARRELGLRTGADMAEAVALLADLGAVTVTPERREGGGRPRRVLRLANGANGAKSVYPAQAPERGVIT